jgi:hypothetical protein
MNTNTSLFFTPLVRKRKALSQPVAAIILVVIVTSLALIVGVLTMARIGVFARSESIRVIEAIFLPSIFMSAMLFHGNV